LKRGRPIVRFKRSESFVHTRSSVGFTIITSGFEFPVHTGQKAATGSGLKLMALAAQAICGTKAASQSRITKCLKKAKKTVVRREYTRADVKELRAHSKAKTPVVKIAKLTKRSVGSLRQKALKLGIRLGHRR
jgi:hypothetical protein